MTEHRLLTPDAFAACFAPPMQDVTAEAKAVVDIWTYVDGLDLAALGIANMGDVAYVYRDGTGRYEHILIETGDDAVFLVVVVDIRIRAVFGHHLLNLKMLYGGDVRG